MMQIDKLDEEFEIAIKMAEEGKKCWNQVVSERGFNKNMCVICLPTVDDELNRASILQIEEYLQAKYYADYYLISRNENRNLLNEYPYIDKKTVYIDRTNMEKMILFMKLINMGDNVIVISLEEPYCNYSMANELKIPLDKYIAGTFLWRTNATNRE